MRLEIENVNVVTDFITELLRRDSYRLLEDGTGDI